MLAQSEALRPEATAVAQRLRRAGRRVDLVLEDKKMKWAFKVGRGSCLACAEGLGRC